MDVTSIGIGRDPVALLRISRATGLNVVMGAGYYIDQTHSDWLRKASVDEIAKSIIKDVDEGVDGTGIRAGIIGEIVKFHIDALSVDLVVMTFAIGKCCFCRPVNRTFNRSTEILSSNEPHCALGPGDQQHWQTCSKCFNRICKW